MFSSLYSSDYKLVHLFLILLYKFEVIPIQYLKKVIIFLLINYGLRGKTICKNTNLNRIRRVDKQLSQYFYLSKINI